MLQNQQTGQAWKPLGYAQAAAGTIDAAAALPSIPTAPGPTFALIRPSAQAVRWRDDGVNPTATVGYPLAAGEELQYTGRNISGLRFISQAAGAILDVVYYTVGL